MVKSRGQAAGRGYPETTVSKSDEGEDCGFERDRQGGD